MLLFASVIAPFVVAQFNVLAGYLGDNRQPWFLHGLDVSAERRQQIMEKFYERDPINNKKFLNLGWPKYVEGIFSDQEQEQVEEIHDRYFAWEIRKPKLLATIDDLNADLLSLVECDHYEDFWKLEMEQRGYGAVYKQRPACPDGCAIFYRKSIFALEAFRGIEFLSSSTGSHTKDSKDTHPNCGDRVGLLTLLRHRTSGRRLIFISTHLARNPEDPHRTKDRARQIAQLMYGLTKFALDHNALNDDNNKNEKSVPAMLAGDMNETNLRHIATIARIKCGLAKETCHPFVFTSKAPKTPYTSVTSCRQMCIDYILYQCNLLEVQETLLDLNQAKISQDQPIPNEKYASDHLPIAFRIGFRDYASALQGYAASWVHTICHQLDMKVQQEETWMNMQPEFPLRLDEIRMAFEYFDSNNDGLCDSQELSYGLTKLHDNEAEAVVPILRFLESQSVLQPLTGAQREKISKLAKPILTLADFTSVYIKSWLQQQPLFADRVQSLQTIFDLDFLAGHAMDAADESGFNNDPSNNEVLMELFNEIDADRDGTVTIDNLFDYVVKTSFSAESFSQRLKDAFHFIDFDESGSFDLDELSESFSTACPFDVNIDIFQNMFDDMGKSYDEKIGLDELADYMVRNYLNSDPSWVSLKGIPSCITEGGV